MHKEAADRPEFWDAHWRAHPPQPVHGPFIDRWYKWPMLRHLPRGEPIVEAGCGNGYIVRALNHAGLAVEGLDFAPRTIDANRAVDPKGSYRVGDVRALPYRDNELGGYISLGVIEHFAEPEREAIIRDAYRCLRPGGAAIFTTPYFSPLRRLKSALGGYRRVSTDLPFYQNFFTAKGLRAFVRAAGFEIAELDAYDFYGGIKNTIGLRRLLDEIKSTGPNYDRFIHHPPKWLRLLCGHMVLVVGKKSGSPSATAVRCAA